MSKNINNSSSFSSKLGHFARSARSKTVLAAAIAATGLGLGSSSFAAPTIPQDVTAITTNTVAGPTSSTNGLSGWGEGASYTYSSTKPPTTYNVSYGGTEDQVASVTAGGTTYDVSATQGTTVVRTYTGLPTVTSLWYTGSGTSGTTSSVPLDGPAYTSYNAALSSNNLLIGADNVFSSKPDTINGANDQSDVARIDVLFSGGFKTSTSEAFSVFDRGTAGSHDPFEIAAITSLSANGAPASYGPLESFGSGAWGNTNLVGTSMADDVLRSNTSGGALHPATAVVQSIGGVLIPSSYLASAGTTIYGYSLFSASVTSADNLVAYNSLPEADDTVDGGLDPTATLGNLYTATAVPEPASASLLALAVGGFMVRRPKRNQA